MISSFMETQESTTPELKEISKTPFEIIEVPESNLDNLYSRDRLISQTNIGTVREKVSYLQNVLEYSENNYNYSLSNNLKNYIRVVERTFFLYCSRLPNYINAEPTEDLIRKKNTTIKYIGIDEKTSTRDEDIKKALSDEFKKSKGNKICVSTSHGATWFALQAANEVKENESTKNAVIVFDNHVDIYTTLDESPESTVWKGNVFRLLGSEGLIERALFIGGVDEYRMITKENRIAKLKNKTVRYDQIRIDDLKQNGKTNRPKLLHYLEETIGYYKEYGITNVVFSVDIDVLNAGKIGYTGFEYNPMKPLDDVSSLDLPLDTDPSELTQTEIDGLNKVIKNHIWANDPNYYDPSGLTLSDIGLSLDTIAQSCKKYGIKFGIKLIGGGSYFGDVVEMSGPDYKGRTATSSTFLLKRIEHIIQNE